MKFAKYWASVELSVDKEKFFGTSEVSIWGSSNESERIAEANAASRANAFSEIISSAEPDFDEYEYWNGNIKEEVIEEVLSEDGRTIAVLTRNHYGALVLNSENVFFGDIDVTESGFLGRLFESLGKTKKDKTYYLKRVEEFQKANTQYTFNVYETFAGLRVIISNHLFDSNSSEVDEIFKALDTDPLYVHLCKHQSCFRARLTPKPWRIGVERPASRFPWASRQEEAEHSQWLRNYDYVSKSYDVVRLLDTFGSGQSNAVVDRVISIHDAHACGTQAELA